MRIPEFNGNSNDAYYGLDQLDKNYYSNAEKVSCSFTCRTRKVIIVVEQITVSRIGCIGLDLLELPVTNDCRGGLVIVEASLQTQMRRNADSFVLAMYKLEYLPLRHRE